MKLFIIMTLLLVCAGAALAVPPLPTSTVRGHVTDLSDNPIPDADVTVRCYEFYPGGMEGQLSTTTDGSGYYEVVFPNDGSFQFSYCYAYSYILVTAEKDGEIGENNRQMEIDYDTTVDVQIPDYEVPEYGMVGAFVAVIGAIAGFMVLRKK